MTQPASQNIADTLRRTAAARPDQRAVLAPTGRDEKGRVVYAQLTFRELEQESDRLARGLRGMGVAAGTRLVLMVRPGLEFIALTFAAFKAGAVVVLIDPGMGIRRVLGCLDQVDPEGFLAIPLVQTVRRFYRRRFSRARFNVTVGSRRGWWGSVPYHRLLGGDWAPFETFPARATDPAAIIFTSGGTGPPKGVLFEHGMFAAQVELLRDYYRIEPGEIDLPGFPLFALFNAAMGVTTVIPDMDPTRPARVNPERIVEAIESQQVTQAFGSPAIWNRVGRHCEAKGVRLPSLKRVLSAGAPVLVSILERMSRALTGSDADIYTPYGATEALPVCSISAREVLGETAARSRQGAGTCVGRPFPGIEVKVIEIAAGPLANWSDVREVPPEEIGEIVVSGPVVTREYFRQPEATRLAKIADGDRFWHRMGDVGYLDIGGRLWFCGRKVHVVETAAGRMFPIPCEAIFNVHPRVFRSALVGLGNKPQQTPAIVVEPEAGQFPRSAADRAQFAAELRQLAAANPLTASITRFLFHRAFPVDVRHNVKIFHEKLAAWAERRMKSR